VALLLIDGADGPVEADQKVASYIQENYKSVVIVINKWDLLASKTEKSLGEYQKIIRDSLKFFEYVPIVFISALKGYRIESVIDTAIAVFTEAKYKISTRQLNEILRRAISRRPPARGVKFKFVSQTKSVTPTFVFFVNKPDDVHFTYIRFLENMIREQFPFTGTPLRLNMKKSTGNEAILEPKRLPKAKFIKGQIIKATKRSDKEKRREQNIKRRTQRLAKKNVATKNTKKKD